MHRRRLIPLLVLTLILSLSSGNGQATDDKSFEIALTKGTYALENENNSEAVRILQTAVELKPEDHTAHLLLGIAQSRQGDDAASRTNLLKALRVKPDDPRTLYELGVSFVKSGEYAEAGDFFSDVEELSTDPQLSQAANNYLAKLPIDERKGQFKTRINLGIQHDSNVILEPDDPVVKSAHNSDWRELALLQIQHTTAPGKSLSGTAGYSFYQSFHNRLEEFNIQQHQLALQGEYRFMSEASLIGRYRLPHTYVDGDLYSNFHIIDIGLKIKSSPRNRLEAFFSHEWRKFFNTSSFSSNDDRAGGFNRVTVNDRYNWRSGGDLIVGYTYELDNTDRNFWSYHAHQGSLAVLQKFGPVSATIKALLQNRYYQERFPGFNERRSDIMQEYSCNLDWKISATWSASISDIYTVNNSDLSIFEYKRNIFGIFVRAQL